MCLKVRDVIQTSAVKIIDCYGPVCDRRYEVCRVSEFERFDNDFTVRIRESTRDVMISDGSHLGRI